MTSTRSLGSVRSQLLSDLVYDRLLGDIIHGELAPGQRLNLDALAEDFGISRTPVREALQRLQMLRFVETSRNARTQVAAWGAADMRERVMLVGGLAATAAATMSPASTSAEIVADESDDIEAFLDVSSQLLGRQFPRVATDVHRDLIHPLALYFASPTASRDIDLDNGRPARATLLGTTVDALADLNFSRAAMLLTDYSDALASALTLPGAGFGSSSWVPTSTRSAAAPARQRSHSAYPAVP